MGGGPLLPPANLHSWKSRQSPSAAPVLGTRLTSGTFQRAPADREGAVLTSKRWRPVVSRSVGL